MKACNFISMVSTFFAVLLCITCMGAVFISFKGDIFFSLGSSTTQLNNSNLLRSHRKQQMMQQQILRDQAEKIGHLDGNISALHVFHGLLSRGGKLCVVPDPPPHGSLSTSHTKVPHARILSYTCGKGYIMLGIPENLLVIVCRQDGTWSRALPNCVDSK